MLQTLGLKIGSPRNHPVGVSLTHRPLPEHVHHRPGRIHPTTPSRPGNRHLQAHLRNLLVGRPHA